MPVDIDQTDDDTPQVTYSREELVFEYGRVDLANRKLNRMIIAQAQRIAELEAELDETVMQRDTALRQLEGIVKPTKRTATRKPPAKRTAAPKKET